MKRKPTPYEARATVHDHFDGSSHCVECAGPCKLIGTEMAYTALVRSLFEGAAFNHAKWIPGLNQMRDSGVPVEHFEHRAREAKERR